MSQLEFYNVCQEVWKYGGIENFIINVYRNIDRSKIQFDFLIHGEKKNHFEEEIKQLGGEIYRVPFSTHYKEYAKQMRMILNENREKYQAIHIHVSYAMGYFDARMAKKCKMKNIIVHSHSANNNIAKRKLIHYLLRNKLTQIADYRLACSREAANWMFSGKEYERINNAIYTEKYKFNPIIREKTRKDIKLEGKFVVGHVGRLSPAKNHSFLLEIFKEITKKEKEAVLLLIGEGELKKKIKQKAQELGILEQIIFIGNSKKVEELLQAMDVFVFPSLFEGFGLAALEAQTTGLPCFVAEHITKEVNVTGLVEFISLEKTPEYWAKKILDKKDNKRENKQDIVKKNKYDMIDIAKELEDFYIKIN